ARELRNEERPEGAVISLSVLPAAARAEVVIGVDGAVEVEEFVLRNPDKIVVDITGAALGIPSGDAYDRIARAGIIDVRYSQYRKNVVRVVLTLDGAHPYSVVRGQRAVRISVEGASKRLDAWHAGAAPMPVVQAPLHVETEARTSVARPAEPSRPEPP